MYDVSTILQFLVNGVGIGCIYGLVGIGFAVIFNASGIVNFAQGAFVMLGGILTYVTFKLGYFPLWLCAILSIVATAAIGATPCAAAAIRPAGRNAACAAERSGRGRGIAGQPAVRMTALRALPAHP